MRTAGVFAERMLCLLVVFNNRQMVFGESRRLLLLLLTRGRCHSGSFAPSGLAGEDDVSEGETGLEYGARARARTGAMASA